MRAIVIGLALLAGGCSEISSDEPLLIDADSKGAPVVRDGVWRTVEPTCKLRDEMAIHSWPECVNWGLVKGGELSIFNGWARQSWQAAGALISPGEPAILQIQSKLSYRYVALRVTRLSPKGDVLEADVWPILCGPRQEPAARPLEWRLSGLGVRGGLFAGLEADGDLACSASSVEPLRAAAKASKSLVEPLHLKWVRAEAK